MKKPYPIIIISGPSGAGEDSIIEGLMKRLPIERVITTTTREMRDNESQGHPYYFIASEEFQKGIDDNNFFEYAKQYNGNHYGVMRDELTRVQKSGKIGIWKLEYQGVIKAKKEIPDITSIFVNAPLDQLEARIRRRDNVSDKYVAERMEYTKKWLEYKDIYNFEILNEDGKLLESIDKTENIIRLTLGLDK